MFNTMYFKDILFKKNLGTDSLAVISRTLASFTQRMLEEFTWMLASPQYAYLYCFFF